MNSTGYMSCVLEVGTKASGWHRILTKVLKGIEGVSYSIDAETGMTHVSGKIDPQTLLMKLAKACKHADLRGIDSHSHQYYAPSAPPARLMPGMVHPNGYAYNGCGYDYGYGSYYDHHGYEPYQYYDHHYGRMMDHYHPPCYQQPLPQRFPQSPPVPDNSLYSPDMQCIIM